MIHPPAASPTTRRRRVAAATRVTVLAAGLALVAGCSGTDGARTQAGAAGAAGSTQVDPTPASPERYVALGDSFTAAPFVPDSVDARGCFRSTRNYPSLVAATLGADDFVDASCSGADTTHMRRQQTTVTGQRVPAQLEALDARTDLVTVGIGGNDFNVYATMTERCPQLAETDRDGAPCRDAMQEDGRDVLLAAIDRTQRRVRAVVEEVRERSPEAEVLLVNYPQLTPEDGRCDELRLARGDRAYAREVAERLDGALRRVAERTGVELVDLWTASEGHDVCSDEPWVNGPVTDLSRALALHPFAAGQQAAAELVLEALRS